MVLLYLCKLYKCNYFYKNIYIICHLLPLKSYPYKEIVAPSSSTFLRGPRGL